MTNSPPAAALATSPNVLRDRIMNPNRAKSEHEHWAARHIADLEARLASERPAAQTPGGEVYGAPHQPWCQPGDEIHRAFRLRFEDPDMREMVFTGAGAEAEAIAAYNQYAPAWNVYLFSGHPRAAPALPVAGVGSPAPSEAEREAAAKLKRLLANDYLVGDYGLGGMGDVSWNDLRHILAALSPTSGEAVAWRPTHRHVGRGTEYRVLFEGAELQAATGDVEEGARLTIYEGADGKLWARRAKEFGDGRFEPLAVIAAPASDAGVEG